MREPHTEALGHSISPPCPFQPHFHLWGFKHADTHRLTPLRGWWELCWPKLAEFSLPQGSWGLWLPEFGTPFMLVRTYSCVCHVWGRACSQGQQLHQQQCCACKQTDDGQAGLAVLVQFPRPVRAPCRVRNSAAASSFLISCQALKTENGCRSDFSRFAENCSSMWVKFWRQTIIINTAVGVCWQDTLALLVTGFGDMMSALNMDVIPDHVWAPDFMLKRAEKFGPLALWRAT